MTDTASITVKVGIPNTPPEAEDDTASTDEDTPVTIDVLGNDSDPDGDSVCIIAVGLPAKGSASTDGAMVNYIPASDFNGVDTFTYLISDGALSDTATVTVTVNPVNDAPVAADDGYATAEEVSLSVAAPGVLGNDTDVDGDLLTALPDSPPAHGVIVLHADGSFVYTPTQDRNGSDSFTYMVSDGFLTDTAAVSVAVTPVNDPPFLSDLPDRTAPPSAPVGPIAFTVGDVDNPAGSLILSGHSSNPLLVPDGSITFGGTGVTRTLVILPTMDLEGTAVITVTVSDGADAAGDTFVLTIAKSRYTIYLPLVVRSRP